MTYRRPIIPLKVALLAVAAAMVWTGLFASPAAAAPNWIRIEGPREIPAAKKLRYRIHCRDACRVDVTARLIWPARPNLVNRLRGRLRAGETRANIVVLNNVARNVLQANYRKSRLRVVVRATNLKTGRRGVTRRTFRFSFQP